MSRRRGERAVRAAGAGRLRGPTGLVLRDFCDRPVNGDEPGVCDSASELLVYDRLLPAFPLSVGRVRSELDQALVHLAVAPARRADIALVVTEAATNVVLHAYVDQAPGLLDVTAAVVSHELRVTVSDCGHGMRPRTDSPGMGMGLSLISQLSDAMTVSAPAAGTGTYVTATFTGATPAMRPAPASSDVRQATRARNDADALREYVEALAATTTALHQDSEALMAEARQALKRAQVLRRERRSAV